MIDELVKVAKEMRAHAYAPYSGYHVGAAALDEKGRIWPGCNVENVSFGATICAERSAVLRLIAEGGRELRALAVSTKDGKAPCGICLQVMAEFTKTPSTTSVVLVSDEGAPELCTLSQLLPLSFKSSEVPRTETI